MQKLHYFLFFFIMANNVTAQVTFTITNLSGTNSSNPRTTTASDGTNTYTLTITANSGTPGLDGSLVFPNLAGDDLTFTVSIGTQQQLFDVTSITVDDIDPDNENVIIKNNDGLTIATHNAGGDVVLSGASLS